MTFTLTITLGNAAMQTGADIRDALRKVAATLYIETSPHRPITRVDGGRIMDENGNGVGKWEVSA